MRLNRRLSKRLTRQKPIDLKLKRDEKGRLGVRMDVELNILEAEPFAQECGIRVGMKILTFCGVNVLTKRDILEVQMKKGKLKECAVTVLYDPHAATDHRVDMLDQLASQELPQVPLGKLKKASVISLDHAKKATHNESVKHPEILSDMIRLQNLIPETKHDNVTPSSKHDVIKTTKKWHDPHEAVSSTTVENGPQYISMAQEQDEEAVRSGKPIPPPKPLYVVFER